MLAPGASGQMFPLCKRAIGFGFPLGKRSRAVSEPSGLCSSRLQRTKTESISTWCRQVLVNQDLHAPWLRTLALTSCSVIHRGSFPAVKLCSSGCLPSDGQQATGLPCTEPPSAANRALVVSPCACLSSPLADSTETAARLSPFACFQVQLLFPRECVRSVRGMGSLCVQLVSPSAPGWMQHHRFSLCQRH